MRRLEIVWKRLLVQDNTCERCNDTGAAVEEAIRLLHSDPETADVDVAYAKEGLGIGRIGESNTVFVNGASIEDILGAEVLETHCRSCCEMTGSQTDCRAINVAGSVYEAIPASLILQAMRRILGLA